MLTEERKKTILDLLSKNKIVKNNDLATKLNTSISTIRRDLQELENEKKLTRIHGGAKLIEKVTEEFSMSEKSSKNMQEKNNIAKYAATLVKDESTIFLDAGSTTYLMIPYLENKNITVVTNSITNAKLLSELNITTYILGGFIKNNTQAIIHSTAANQLKTLHFDYAFLGTNTIHSNFGYMTPDIEEANLKKIALNQSQTSYILADHTKFNHLSFVKFADIEKAIIITDYLPENCTEELKNKTTIKEINA